MCVLEYCPLSLSLSQNSVDMCVKGVEILDHLVDLMNQAESVRSLTKHRKIASSFKDELLFDIFNLSCSLLRQTNAQDEAQVNLEHVRHL